MRLVDKLVYKDLIPFFVTGMALFSGLWFAADPVLKASQYLSMGVPFIVVVHIVAVYIPPILALTLPMGMLLAVLQGFGRLSGDSEAVALFAGGIPFARIAAPAAVMGLVASLIGYGINDRLAPAATQTKDDLQQQIVKYGASPALAQQHLHFDVRNGQELLATVQIEGGLDVHTKTMRGVTIVFYDHGQAATLVQAASGQFLGKTPDDLKHWRLSDVDTFQLREGSQPVPGHIPIPGHLDVGNSVDLGLSGVLTQTPEEMSLLNRDVTALTFTETRRRIALMQNGGYSQVDIRGAQVDLWSRIALPFSALIFTVIGSPLGLRPQRSSKMIGWFLAILIIFGYYVLYTTMSYAARGGALPPMLAAFLPDLLGLTIGGALVWKASRL